MDSTVGFDPASSSSSETLVETLLFEILDLPAAERMAALQAMCDRHPELADTLQRRLALLATELPATSADESPARLGRFELLRRLGSGAADVYLASDPAAGTEVVVKFLRHPDLLDEGTRQSLERAVTAATRLDHPGICPVLEIGEVEGMPYLVQPYFAGITLAEWLERQRVRGATSGRLEVAAADIDLVLGWLEQIARALHVAHQHGLLHRDVKPANILVPFQGGSRLLDFGLCQELRPAAAGAPMVPVGGTLAYMAPELLSPRERPVGPAADIHALGVTLFECVTLRLPYSAADDQQLCRAILLQAPPDPRRWNRHLPRGLHRVIACALAKAPWERYPTAAAFADDLARLRVGERVAPPRAGLWRRSVLWCRAHRRRMLSVSLVLLLVPVLALVFAARIRAGGLEADLELLAIPVRLRAAESRARELVPGWPEQVPLLTEWLTQEGEPLAALLPALCARIAELEPDPAAAAEFLLALRVAKERLEPFATGERGAVARVRDRLAWARIAAATLAAQASAWQETIAQIAADSRYRGLRLEPQYDLVPLGRDPRSGLFEFYHARSGWPGTQAVVRDQATGQLVLHDLFGLVFVLIPPGRCLLGEQGYDPRRPRYDAAAAGYSEPFEFEFDAFFVSKYEMTQGQWLRLTGEQPARFQVGRRYWGDPEVGYRHPVESISPLRCDEVLRDHGLVLPTEAQWEYACGAGSSSRFYFGNDPDLLPAHANIDDRRWLASSPGLVGVRDADDGFACLAPVGRYQANPFGLHDVYGNVAEWCRDTCVDHADSIPMLGDGLRYPPRPDGLRSFRGGRYWQSLPTSRRLGAPPETRHYSMGLRPARPLDGGPR